LTKSLDKDLEVIDQQSETKFPVLSESVPRLKEPGRNRFNGLKTAEVDSEIEDQLENEIKEILDLA